MFLLQTGHQPGVYVPLRALFLVLKSKPNFRWSLLGKGGGGQKSLYM